jgi:hypothetical protein
MIAAKYKVMGRIAPGLALAYLFFLLFPHIDAVSHVHEGGGHAHHHGFLSAHDVALERAALEAVPRGIPKNGVDFGDVPPALFAVGDYGRSLTASADAGHTHFQEDPNLPGTGSPAFSNGGEPTTCSAPGTVPSFAPALAVRAAPARAPPLAS